MLYRFYTCKNSKKAANTYVICVLIFCYASVYFEEVFICSMRSAMIMRSVDFVGTIFWKKACKRVPLFCNFAPRKGNVVYAIKANA
jgi:hypothetical protein